MDRLKGKVAIITGAAGYLGSATARLFAAEGARVLCADIAEDRLEALVAGIRSEGGTATALPTDVRHEEEIARMVDFAVGTYGRLDVLHNNATSHGAGSDTNVVDTPDAVWDWAIRINLYATVWGCRHAIPRMIETGGGSIINMASMLHRMGGHDLVAMGTVKAAIVALTRYVATAHGKDGIRANCIAPGFTMSPAQVEALPRIFSETHLQHALTPRLGVSSDQAYAALYLASDESAFVTGHTLEVDGGLGAHSPADPQLAAARVGAQSKASD